MRSSSLLKQPQVKTVTKGFMPTELNLSRTEEQDLNTNVSGLIAALKACSIARDFRGGKRIHAAVRDSSVLRSNTFLANSLVNMYAKCGSMADARQVFEEIPARSVVSWNSLISGYAGNGECELALELLARMKREGCCEPDAGSYVAGLMACSGLAAKEEGRFVDGKLVKANCIAMGMEVHSEALRSGCGSSIFLASNLVNMYAKCGSMFDARIVFDRMEVRDLVSWNALVLGYVENGDNELALKLFSCLELEGHPPDTRTFVAALMACGNLAEEEAGSRVDGRLVKVGCLKIGLEIHRQASESGCSSHLFVSAALLNMYVKCGSLGDAWEVFRGMFRHDVVSWTMMILGCAENGEAELALELFEKMQAEGCRPDSRTFVAAMVACGNLAARPQQNKVVLLEKARSLHSQAAKLGCGAEIKVENTLIDMYSKCGSLEEAVIIFERMLRRDVVSWNVVLHGCVENGDFELALKFFARMRSGGGEANGATFIAAAMACSRLAEKQDRKSAKLRVLEEQGTTIHSEAAKGGFDKQIFVASALVEMFARCGCMEKARSVFENLLLLDTISWNGMILGYAENGDPESALEIFEAMKKAGGCAPNFRTYVAALLACGSLACLERGSRIHGEVCRSGLEKDVFVASGLVDLYGKCGRTDKAQQVFDSKRKTDAVSWSALMAGYSFKGDSERVLRLFEEMMEAGLQADGVTILLVLTACSRSGLVETGRRCFGGMVSRFGIQPEMKHYHCVIDMLGRANRVEEAVAMAREMPYEPSVVTCTTLLSACCKWKDLAMAKAAFEMFVAIEGDDHRAGYSLMANLYGSVGMWEEQKKVAELGRRRRLSERKELS